MNFQHTEDRRMLADTLNRFVTEQYGFETRDRIARSPEGFSADLWNRFAELGIIGALFDETDGGFGGGGFDIAVVFESLGRGLVVEPDILLLDEPLGALDANLRKAIQNELKLLQRNLGVTFAHHSECVDDSNVCRALRARDLRSCWHGVLRVVHAG